MKYKVYVSALATINIDDHVRISTTDNRLIEEWFGINSTETRKRKKR